MKKLFNPGGLILESESSREFIVLYEFPEIPVGSTESKAVLKKG